MHSQNPVPSMDSRPEDRRRSKRFPLVVPVSLKWVGLDGLPVTVDGRAVEGSDHGGLLEIPEHPPFGKEAALTNLVSRQTIMVQVLSLRTTKDGAIRGQAVQFLALSKSFWAAAGMEGQVEAEFPSGSPDSLPQPSRPSRWKSLLQFLLGRPGY